MCTVSGEILLFRQEKGPDIQLATFGDEFYARYETTDGFTVVYDEERGHYCYAQVVEGRFASTGTSVLKPAPLGLRRHLKEAGTIRNEKFERRYNRIRPRETSGGSHRFRTLGPASGLLEGRRVSQGSIRGLTIIVDFPDMPTQIAIADVDALLNGDNYRQNGNHCSVKEYFGIVSNRKLEYTNTVVGPIRLSRNRNFYKDTLLVEEALTIAVNQGLDLSEFDSRNEGIVDAVNFMYAGESVFEGDLWPHNFSIELRFGNIRTHFYMLTGLGRHRVDLSIGTFCHESGHLLCRFPDLYDYGRRDGDSEKSQGIGRYCLMGSGNHLNLGRTPSPVCGYLRELAGWVDQEILLNQTAEFEVRHGDYGTILKYETDKSNEYFIIENRSQLGLDAHLPSNGLAVFHCDTLGSNEWEDGTRNKHYQCALIQADGHLDLENNRNRGDDTDLFKAIPGLALAHHTIPHSREWDGTDSGLILSDVSAPGQFIQFRVGQSIDKKIASGESNPFLLIPDNQPAGVSDVIALSQLGIVKSLAIEVDLTHTYIGDLQVILKSPSGKTAILHNREGGHKDDLRKTYTSETLPALAALLGEKLSGPWELHIKDTARQDTGRLNRWTIEAAFESAGSIASGEVAPNLDIPDSMAQGVSSRIAIADVGTAKGLTVNVEIAHTYIGDLHVELIAPSGQSVTLHDRAGGSKSDLRRTFDKDSLPGLETLVGEPIQGEWTLRVRDLASFDEGKLEKWSLSVPF